MEQLELFDTDPPEKLLDGIQMLLARMESNPEEFDLSEGVWYSTVRRVVDNEDGLFTEAEKTAVANKMRCVVRQNFSSSVLRKVMQINSPRSENEANSFTFTRKELVSKLKVQLDKEFRKAYTDAFTPTFEDHKGYPA